MGEPLKNMFGMEVPQTIAGMIYGQYPDFPVDSFLEFVGKKYELLSLTLRSDRIAEGLFNFLPKNYVQAIDILIRTLGPRLDKTENMGMTPFLYLPYVQFVAKYGTSHFEESMNAQYELTQRFTAEFSLREFIERYPEKSLSRLKIWAVDPSVHVRRLVSEGTRPRLPWAKRLPMFQKDPVPVLNLLELLKDDPELYVRRSVANNLNDIGKDHPRILADTARKWLKNASENRKWLIRHALRSAKKRGDARILNLLGYRACREVKIEPLSLPAKAHIGENIRIRFKARNTSEDELQNWLVNLKIYYIKASGKPSPKVFNLAESSVKPGDSVSYGKVISLRQMTTRKHYPGTHRVDVTLNGTDIYLGSFDLLP